MQAIPINNFQYTYFKTLTAEMLNVNKHLVWETENECGKFGVKSQNIA